MLWPIISLIWYKTDQAIYLVIIIYFICLQFKMHMSNVDINKSLEWKGVVGRKKQLYSLYLFFSLTSQFGPTLSNSASINHTDFNHVFKNTKQAIHTENIHYLYNNTKLYRVYILHYTLTACYVFLREKMYLLSLLSSWTETKFHYFSSGFFKIIIISDHLKL